MKQYLENIVEFYHDKAGDMRHFFSCVGRFFYWGWALKESYDFDYGCLEEMIYLKLKRMAVVFEQDDMHCWCNDEDCDEYHEYRAFLLALKLAERLNTRSDIVYAKYAEEKHTERWGEYDFNREKEKGILFSIRRKNIVTEDDIILERKQNRALLDLSHRIYQRDRRNFYAILDKYARNWWV